MRGAKQEVREFGALTSPADEDRFSQGLKTSRSSFANAKLKYGEMDM